MMRQLLNLHKRLEMMAVSDILIRGMEEPPFCSACRMLDGDTNDGFCHAANKWFDDEWFCWHQYPEGDIATDKPLNCPLVPLPPHGPLIDMNERLRKRSLFDWKDYEVTVGSMLCDPMLLDKPKVIVEAER